MSYHLFPEASYRRCWRGKGLYVYSMRNTSLSADRYFLSINNFMKETTPICHLDVNDRTFGVP